MNVPVSDELNWTLRRPGGRLFATVAVMRVTVASSAASVDGSAATCTIALGLTATKETSVVCTNPRRVAVTRAVVSCLVLWRRNGGDAIAIGNRAHRGPGRGAVGGAARRQGPGGRLEGDDPLFGRQERLPRRRRHHDLGKAIRRHRRGTGGEGPEHVAGNHGIRRRCRRETPDTPLVETSTVAPVNAGVALQQRGRRAEGDDDDQPHFPAVGGGRGKELAGAGLEGQGLELRGGFAPGSIVAAIVARETPSAAMRSGVIGQDEIGCTREGSDQAGRSDIRPPAPPARRQPYGTSREGPVANCTSKSPEASQLTGGAP